MYAVTFVSLTTPEIVLLRSVTLTDDLYSTAVCVSCEVTSTQVLAFRLRSEGTPCDKTVLHTDRPFFVSLPPPPLYSP